jgi:hypothetical protein
MGPVKPHGFKPLATHHFATRGTGGFTSQWQDVD